MLDPDGKLIAVTFLSAVFIAAAVSWWLN